MNRGPAEGFAATVATDDPAVLSSPPGATLPPERLAGRYEILALIGVGGMGSVYRARDCELDETVALKVLRPELARDPSMVERFRREVKLARKITHTSVARTFDLGEHNGERFLTMELIAGESLAALLARQGAMPIDTFIETVTTICAGLTAAHAAGVVHRDLKPDNVLVTPAGRVVITDFGIARAVDPGVAHPTMGAAVGTPAYMSPEQVEAQPDVDARADIYALGAMMYEMLTGQLPWQGESIFAIAAARLVKPPPDPRPARTDLPDVIAHLVMRCMARAPQDRPSSAVEVASCLAGATLLPPLANPLPLAPRTPDASAQSSAKTVAVLPFRSAGADDYLVEGLVDDIIDTLSMTAGLRVRPRSAVAHLQGTQRDARDLGRELSVQVVVDGSVRVAGDALRVSARLLSVTDGFQLWAKRWDGARADVLRIADEAAREIATALTVAAQPERVRTTDPEAIDLYLRGRHEFFKFAPDAVSKSRDLLLAARDRAPDDALIATGYALAVARMLGMPVASTATLDEGRTAALRAQQLAPLAADPLVALASIALHEGDLQRCANLIAEALRRSPLHPDAWERAAQLLSETGPTSAARTRIERALALEPRFGNVVALRARLDAFDRNWEAVERWTTEALNTKEPRSVQWILLVRMAAWRDDARMAETLIPILEQSTTVQAPLVLSLCRSILSRNLTDEQRSASELLLALIPGTKRAKSAYHQISAEAFALVVDHAAAIASIERAVESGLFDLEWMDRCTTLATLREEPAFQAARATVLGRANHVRAAFGEPPAT